MAIAKRNPKQAPAQPTLVELARDIEKASNNLEAMKYPNLILDCVGIGLNSRNVLNQLLKAYRTVERASEQSKRLTRRIGAAAMTVRCREVDSHAAYGSTTTLALVRRNRGSGWILAVCPHHAAELAPLGFEAYDQATMHPAWLTPMRPWGCALCCGVTTIADVKRCRCKAGDLECPVPGHVADEDRKYGVRRRAAMKGWRTRRAGGAA